MGRPVDMPQRAMVRDLTRGGASFRIDWDVRTAYDFIFSLSGDAGSTDDLPASDRAWLTDTRKSLPPDVQDAIELLFESELAIHAGVLLVDQPDVRTSADVVALVESTSPTWVASASYGPTFSGSPRSPYSRRSTALCSRERSGRASNATSRADATPESTTTRPAYAASTSPESNA